MLKPIFNAKLLDSALWQCFSGIWQVSVNKLMDLQMVAHLTVKKSAQGHITRHQLSHGDDDHFTIALHGDRGSPRCRCHGATGMWMMTCGQTTQPYQSQHSSSFHIDLALTWHNSPLIPQEEDRRSTTSTTAHLSSARVRCASPRIICALSASRD